MRDLRFKDFITLQRGFDLPKSERRGGPYPVMGAAQRQGYHAEHKVDGPVVTTGRSGTLGEVLFEAGRAWPLNTALWVKDFKGNVPRYVYYFLKTLKLDEYNSGAGVPTLNRNHLDELPLRVHEVPTQRRIAAILSAYDDLIEVNTRRIAILEEMARQVYEEWFVRGRGDGWPEVPLGEIVGSHIGGGWGKDRPDAKHVAPAYVIRGTDIPGSRVGDTATVPYRFHSHSNLASRCLEPWDIVFEASGGSKDQSVGRTVLLAPELLASFDAAVICASFCKRITANRSGPSWAFLYETLQRCREVGEVAQYEVQSTGIKNLGFKSFLSGVTVALPPVEMTGAFEREVEPIYRLTATLGLQNTNLRAQRDLLLPRLVSGKLDISEAGAAAEESAA